MTSNRNKAAVPTSMQSMTSADTSSSITTWPCSSTHTACSVVWEDGRGDPTSYPIAALNPPRSAMVTVFDQVSDHRRIG